MRIIDDENFLDLTEDQKRAAMLSIYNIGRYRRRLRKKAKKYFDQVVSDIGYMFVERADYIKDFKTISENEMLETLKGLSEVQKEWYVIIAHGMLESIDRPKMKQQRAFAHSLLSIGIDKDKYIDIMKKMEAHYKQTQERSDKQARDSMNVLLSGVEKMTDRAFPKGERDIEAGAKELLNILNNTIEPDFAKVIFVKSVAISRITDKFDKERLRDHLSLYCIKYFNDDQIEKFYEYLTVLTKAMIINGRTPSEVKREGDSYVW